MRDAALVRPDETANGSPVVLLTPGPLSTSAGVRQAMIRDWATRDQEFRDLTSRVRAKLLAISGLGEGFTCVPLAGSGTSALEAAIGTLIPRTGKVLVVVNGAYGQRLADLCHVLQRPFSVFESPEGQALSVPALAATLASDRAFTHIAIVHCETSSGLLNPVDRVAELAERFGCEAIVDAMSSFGALPTPLGRGVAAIVSSANKCLEGVPGLAFVLARTHALKAASGNSPSLTLDLAAQLEGLSSTGEWRFTAPTHVMAALDQALTEHSAEGGVAARGRRYTANAKVVIERLSAAGLTPLLDDDLRSPIIVSFLQPAEDWFDFDAFYAAVKSRGFILYPGKSRSVRTFRVGCIGHVDSSVLEQAATVVVGVLAMMKQDKLSVFARPSAPLRPTEAKLAIRIEEKSS